MMTTLVSRLLPSMASLLQQQSAAIILPLAALVYVVLVENKIVLFETAFNGLKLLAHVTVAVVLVGLTNCVTLYSLLLMIEAKRVVIQRNKEGFFFVEICTDDDKENEEHQEKSRGTHDAIANANSYSTLWEDTFDILSGPPVIVEAQEYIHHLQSQPLIPTPGSAFRHRFAGEEPLSVVNSLEIQRLHRLFHDAASAPPTPVLGRATKARRETPERRHSMPLFDSQRAFFMVPSFENERQMEVSFLSPPKLANSKSFKLTPSPKTHDAPEFSLGVTPRRGGVDKTLRFSDCSRSDYSSWWTPDSQSTTATPTKSMSIVNSHMKAVPKRVTLDEAYDADDELLNSASGWKEELLNQKTTPLPNNYKVRRPTPIPLLRMQQELFHMPTIEEVKRVNPYIDEEETRDGPPLDDKSFIVSLKD